MAVGVRIPRRSDEQSADHDSLARVVNEHGRLLDLRAETDVKGDIVADTGHRMAIGPLARSDLVASQTYVLHWANQSAIVGTFAPWRSGSIVGISVWLSGAVAGAGPPATVLQVRILRGATVIDTVTLAVGATKASRVYAQNKLSFATDDILGVQAITDASWTTVGSDIVVWLGVEM